MAFLGFKVPPETSRLFSRIDVPGERETFHHITVLNFGDDMSISDVARAIEVGFGVASRMEPFSVRTDTVSTFPSGPNGTPIICLVESLALHELWGDLKEAFDKAGIPFSKKFPVYRPHVTLSFSPEAIPDRKIPVIEWGAHELILWSGDSGDSGLIAHMPFALRAASRGLITYDLRKNLIRHRVATRFKNGD